MKSDPESQYITYQASLLLKGGRGSEFPCKVYQITTKSNQLDTLDINHQGTSQQADYHFYCS